MRATGAWGRRGGRGNSQSVNHLAPVGSLGLPAQLQGGTKHGPQMAQLPDSPLQIRQTVLDEGPNLPARGGRSVTQAQQGCDVFEREAVGLRGADEPKPLE